MKILLIDQPIRNRGDESAHKALVRSLLGALPDISVTVPYRYPVRDMEPFMVPGVRYVHTEDTPPTRATQRRSRLTVMNRFFTNRLLFIRCSARIYTPRPIRSSDSTGH